MARVRKPTKIKEPVKLRMKALSDGNKSLYLDISTNWKGRRRSAYRKASGRI